MRDGAITAGVLGGSVALWILHGLVKTIRDLLSERAAGWLLPAGQPVTFRLAQLVALVARALAPKRVAEFDRDRRWYTFFPVVQTLHFWPDPDSAIAELEADLRAECRVLSPLRLVLPLLRTSLQLRLRNLWQIAKGIVFAPVAIGLVVLLLVPATLVEEIDALNNLNSRAVTGIRAMRRWAAGRGEQSSNDNR